MVGFNFNNTSTTWQGMKPWSCYHCLKPQAFSNSGVLRDHVFDYHEFNIESQISKDRIRQIHYMEHARDNAYTLTPPSSHEYVTIKAACYNWEVNACIDTGSDVSVIDDSIVPPGLAIKCSSITMKGVCGLQISSYYVNVKVLLLDISTNTEVTVKAYLMKHLQPGLILGMNFLAEQKVTIQIGRKIIIMQNEVEISLLHDGGAPGAMMHITTCIPMFEVMRVRRLKWAVLNTTKQNIQKTETHAISYPKSRAISKIECLKPTPETEQTEHTETPVFTPPKPTFACQHCKHSFPSNTKLKSHTHRCYKKQPRRRELQGP